LRIVRHSRDGFKIAEQDLELRGPGEILGTEQSGLSDYRLVDLSRDRDLLREAEHLAQQLYADHPAQISFLTKRWLRTKQAEAISSKL
jgi:ATP-dependent DNA helicase RecG